MQITDRTEGQAKQDAATIAIMPGTTITVRAGARLKNMGSPYTQQFEVPITLGFVMVYDGRLVGRDEDGVCYAVADGDYVVHADRTEQHQTEYAKARARQQAAWKLSDAADRGKGPFKYQGRATVVQFAMIEDEYKAATAEVERWKAVWNTGRAN